NGLEYGQTWTSRGDHTEPPRARPRPRATRHAARAEDPGRRAGTRPEAAERARPGATAEGPPQHRLGGLSGPGRLRPRRAAPRVRRVRSRDRARIAAGRAQPGRDDPVRAARRLPQGVLGPAAPARARALAGRGPAGP